MTLHSKYAPLASVCMSDAGSMCVFLHHWAFVFNCRDKHLLARVAPLPTCVCAVGNSAAARTCRERSAALSRADSRNAAINLILLSWVDLD